MTLLRSALFNLFFFAMTFVMTVALATPVRFAAPHRMLDVARLWARIMVWAAARDLRHPPRGVRPGTRRTAARP